MSGGGERRMKPPRLGGLAVLAVLLVLLPLVLPNNFYLDVAILAGFNAIVCIGLNLLIGYAGQVSLGHAGFFGVGAYASAVLVTSHGWPALGALGAGAVLSAAIAYALARPILRLKGHYLAMATLGVGVIISIVLRTESQITGGPDGMMVDPLSVLGVEIVGERVWYWVVAAVLLLAVWLALNLVDSSAGRALRAVHGSEVAAETLGVDTAGAKARVFVLSAVFASVAGGLFAHYTGLITPASAGFIKSVELVTMVVFGGMASVFGSVAGAVVITLLPQVLTVFADYQHLMLGLVLMLTMVFMPRGLLPTLAAAGTARRRA